LFTIYHLNSNATHVQQSIMISVVLTQGQTLCERASEINIL